MLSGPRIFKLLNFCSSQLISIPLSLAAYVFVPSVFGENIPTAEFEMMQKLLAGT